MFKKCARVYVCVCVCMCVCICLSLTIFLSVFISVCLGWSVCLHVCELACTCVSTKLQHNILLLTDIFVVFMQWIGLVVTVIIFINAGEIEIAPTAGSVQEADQVVTR